MSFLWPRMLWLLFCLPVFVLLYVALLRARRKQGLRYASLNLVKAAAGKGPGFKRHVPAALFLVSVGLMVVSLGRPAADVTLPSERGTVILAMDISGSMRANDISPSRIEAAQESARLFVKSQPSTVRIGVVAFAGTATLVQAPTDNRDEVLAALDRLYVQRATAIGSGILVSLSAIFPDLQFDLGRPGPNFGFGGGPFGRGGFGGFGGGQGSGGFGQNANPVPLPDPNAQTVPLSKQPLPPPVAPGSYRSAAIILLSDGQSNTGTDPLQAAQTAADLGVRIFTVGLGTTGGQMLGFGGWRMRVQLDEDTLKKVAATTVGRYYRAGSEGQLTDIYRNLSLQLITEKQKTEITALFTAGAGAIALLAVGLSLLWFGRIL